MKSHLKAGEFMNNQERRKLVLQYLHSEKRPVKGTEMANKFDVSRQVIVQDIALLRAEGEDIMATPQGYVIVQDNRGKIIKKVVIKHQGYEEIEDELQTMIDYGVRVIDVIIDHPIYGEIRSPLNISYKRELEEFMLKIRTEKAEPLASLTEGVHIHTLEVPDEECFRKVKEALSKKGYLIEG